LADFNIPLEFLNPSDETAPVPDDNAPLNDAVGGGK
jgi:hypothetical protein